MNIFRHLSLLFFLIIFSTTSMQAQTKHALIIAIGKYKYWDAISSLTDTGYIKKALEKQGFPWENISVITDAKATKTGIENAFKTLVSRVKDSDIVVIHISSHGEQVEDDKNKDEIDGFDECIVAWDAPKVSNKDLLTPALEKYYFRDDVFGIYVNQLRSKLGKKGDVLVIIDACHSGSGTRGTRKVRGNAPPLKSKSFAPPAKTKQTIPSVFLESRKENTGNQNLATYVVISGALAEENNSEAWYDDEQNIPGGSLSIAVTRSFQTLKPGSTYRSLFADIMSIVNQIAREQTPVIEGDGIDRELFGGNFVEQKPYIEIEEIKSDSLTLILKGGRMMGLDNGAKIDLYPSGTNDPSREKLIASGVITDAEPFRSSVKLDKKPGFEQPAKGWVFITEPVYKIKPLVLQLGPVSRGGAVSGFSKEEETNIKNGLKELPLISFEGQAELILVKGVTNDSLIITSNGALYSEVKKNDPANLSKQLKRYSQYKFLSNLELSDSSCKLEVKLVPYYIKGGKPQHKADLSAIKEHMPNGIFECNVGDSIVIWAKNNGDNRVYLNILDLQPDGIINPIFPIHKGKALINPEELFIEPGEEKLFIENKKIGIGPPTGLEIFKIFVSATEINMEKIADRDLKERGSFSFLQQLVDKSYEIKSRGDISAGQPKGSVYNLLFRINPAVK